MKTKRNLIVLFVTSLLTLTGCGNSNPASLNKYQKVKKAFEAVGRTLDLKPNNRRSLPSRTPNMHGDMSNFDSYFTNAATDEKIEDQIDFDSPPLMQFQYLKVIYDSIGNSYSFGTKYSHTITGDIYIDFETGYRDKEKTEANKHGFAFDFSVYINIDEANLITAEVGMDITLTQGNESYKYYKYALLILDYDFEKSDDNYELALYDYGDEKDISFLSCDFGYEYDYCLVSHNKLTEWRKFRYEADQKMVKDSAHPTLDSYINVGASIQGDNQRWYKNNVLKRIDSNTQQSLLIAKELYLNFGLNNTDLNPEGFFNKSSTDSTVIKTIYDGASREYGDELIYHIVGNDEDDEPSDNGWPSQDIEYITGMSNIIFSNREGVSYTSRREDVDGESNSVIITVSGATANEYEEFEGLLLVGYNFERLPDQQGFHIYYLGLIDNTSLTVLVSRTNNTIAFTHYFGGGGQSQYEPIELENMITYDLPYNTYYQNYFTTEKDIFTVLAKKFDDNNIDKIFTNKIVVEKSQKVDFVVSEKEIEYVGEDTKSVKDARDILVTQYSGYYYQQWNATNHKNIFINKEDHKDIVIFEVGSEDNVFSVYFFRCVDDTMDKYLNGQVERYVDIKIYVHPHEGDVFLSDTISVQNGDSVLQYLDANTKYYLDADLTTLLTEENSYAYEGMELHRRDYDDPEYEMIFVPGGIDYTYAYSDYTANDIDEEGVYNYVMNLTGDPSIRSYLEGKISTSQKANNKIYHIQIGPEAAQYMKMSEAEAAKMIYAQYTKEYSSWKKGTKGEYFYTGDKEEDVVFFNKEHLGEGMIEFIHVQLNSKVMDDYEAGNEPGGGESGGGGEATTVQVILLIYKDGKLDSNAIINCPVGEDVRPYLNDYEGNYYLDSNFNNRLNDSNSAAYQGMIIYINMNSSGGGSQEEYTTIYLIINGEDGNVNTVEVRAKVGDDVYSYISSYGDEFYLDAEHKNKINKGECSVSYDMTIYVKINSGEEETKTGLVNVYVYQDGALYDSHIFGAPIGDDIRPYLDNYDQTGTRYVDASFSTLLDDSNCSIYDGMNIYIVRTSEAPQEEDNVTIQIFLFNSSGEKLGTDKITCKVGDDVRDYLRSYNGDIFLDSSFSTPLTAKNCKAYEGMMLYIILRGK